MYDVDIFWNNKQKVKSYTINALNYNNVHDPLNLIIWSRYEYFIYLHLSNANIVYIKLAAVRSKIWYNSAIVVNICLFIVGIYLHKKRLKVYVEFCFFFI